MTGNTTRDTDDYHFEGMALEDVENLEGLHRFIPIVLDNGDKIPCWLANVIYVNGEIAY